MGPLGAANAWTEALQKYRKAVHRLSQGSWGLHLSTLVYNVHVSSILGFVAQFYPPSKEILDAEASALHRFVRGPSNWCSAIELFHIDSWLGCTCRFHSIGAVSLSARARISHCDHNVIIGRKDQLEDEFLDSDNRRPSWYKWFDNSPFHMLDQAILELSSSNITIPRITAQILGRVSHVAHRDPDMFVK